MVSIDFTFSTSSDTHTPRECEYESSWEWFFRCPGILDLEQQQEQRLAWRNLKKVSSKQLPAISLEKQYQHTFRGRLFPIGGSKK